MAKWYVGVTSDEAGSNETQPMQEFEHLDDAKVAVFDITSAAAPAKIEYTKTMIYERFEVSPINPGPGVWDKFYVFIFASAL